MSPSATPTATTILSDGGTGDAVNYKYMPDIIREKIKNRHTYIEN